MRAVLIALLAFSSSACALTGLNAGAKTYDAQVIAVASVRADLLPAVRAMVTAEGWSLESVDEANGRLQAVTPVDSSLGVDMRERWTFVIADYEISVTRVLEARFSAGEDWQSEGTVCTGYVYLRERQVLASLERAFTDGKRYAMMPL